MLDRTDKSILEILQHNSRISNQELADKVALSPSPCLRRVKRLEEEGYINHYVAILNPEKINLNLSILVSVCLNGHDPEVMKKFEEAISALPQVVQCFLIAGQAADYMLKIVVPSLNDYQEFLLNKLMCIKGVSNVQSSFILRNIIDKTSLPLLSV